MALPRSHIASLERDLDVHEARLKHLREQIARLAAEADAHEMILRLGRDPCVRAALAALHDASEEAQSDGQDPAQLLRAHDVELPPGATVRWSGDGDRAGIAVSLRVGESAFTCVWDRTDGFYLRQDGAAAPSS